MLYKNKYAVRVFYQITKYTTCRREVTEIADRPVRLLLNYGLHFPRFSFVMNYLKRSKKIREKIAGK